MAENVSIVIKAFDKTKPAFKGVTSALSGITSAVFSMKTALVAVGGAAGFGYLVNSSLKATDSLKKTADKIGTTTEALGGLRYAAELAGITTQTMDMALQRFTRRTAEAAAGTGEAKAAIKELGINAQELNRMPLDKRMVVLADAFSGVASESDKLRLAFKLFDSEGAALVNVLSQGGDGLKEMLGEARLLGLTMSGSAAKGVEDTVDSLTKLQSLFKGITDQTVAAFAPAIEMIVERFTGFLQRSIEAKGGVEAFARALAVDLLSAVQGALTAFQSLANGFIQVYNEANRIKNSLKDAFGYGLKSASEYRKELNSIKAQMEGLKNASNMTVDQQLAAVDVAKKRYDETLKLYQAAQDAEAETPVPLVDFVSVLDAQIEGLKKSLSDVNTAVETSIPPVIKSLSDIELGFKSWSDTLPDMNTNIQNLTRQGLDGLTDALANGITGAANFADAIKSMAKSVVDSLIKMLIQKYIVDAAFGFITTAIGGTQAGINSSAGYSAGMGDPFASNFGGKAIGGSVQRGQPYMVGERGMEMFIPNQSGSIVSNDKLNNGGGVVVNQTINVTTGVQQTVRAEIATLMPQIASAAKNAVADARMRGGNYSKMLVGA